MDWRRARLGREAGATSSAGSWTVGAAEEVDEGEEGGKGQISTSSRASRGASPYGINIRGGDVTSGDVDLAWVK